MGGKLTCELTAAEAARGGLLPRWREGRGKAAIFCLLIKGGGTEGGLDLVVAKTA